VWNRWRKNVRMGNWLAQSGFPVYWCMCVCVSVASLELVRLKAPS